jgi:hypothetical protein
MTISAIESSQITSSILATNLQPLTPATDNSTHVSLGAASSTQISGPGQLFSRLQQLSEKDPAKFKQVAQHIADQLHQAAQEKSGKAADFENQLADKFAAAAQSGNLSSLQPPKPEGGSEGAHHPHHHHGGSGGGQIAAIFSSALDEVNQALGIDEAPPAPEASQATAG